VKPQTIYFSGDAGNIVSNIDWTTWGPSTGVGTGRWMYDDCVPNCAEGSTTFYDAVITVSALSGGQFTQLTEQQTGPHGRTYVFTLPNGGIPGASSGSTFDQ